MKNMRLVSSISALLLLLFMFVSGCRPTPLPSIVAISAISPDLNSEVDPDFGRSEWFIIVDIETMDYEFIEGAGKTLEKGAGPASANQVIDKGVGAVLTGECGYGAYAVLESARVRVITQVLGTIEDVIDKYKLGEY